MTTRGTWFVSPVVWVVASGLVQLVGPSTLTWQYSGPRVAGSTQLCRVAGMK
jgi:hypothetical protein